MAQVILALQQKGGACKTTMLCCLAGYMADDNARVLLIDTDVQKSAFAWAEQWDANDRLKTVCCLDEDQLPELVDKSSSSFDVILIDTAGYDSRMATYAVQLADLILVPCGSSETNLVGAAKTVSHVELLNKRSASPPNCKIVVWGVNRTSNVFKNTLETLELNELGFLSHKIPHLTGFQEMSWTGANPIGKAKSEVRQFVAALQNEKLLDFYK